MEIRSSRREESLSNRRRMLDRATEHSGKDGFHSVPNGLKKEWDGVESVLTVPWQAAIARILETPDVVSYIVGK